METKGQYIYFRVYERERGGERERERDWEGGRVVLIFIERDLG